MWGSNEGHSWMSLGGVGHVELSKGFFGLTDVIEKGVCGVCIERERDVGLVCGRGRDIRREREGYG